MRTEPRTSTFGSTFSESILSIVRTETHSVAAADFLLSKSGVIGIDCQAIWRTVSRRTECEVIKYSYLNCGGIQYVAGRMRFRKSACSVALQHQSQICASETKISSGRRPLLAPCLGIAVGPSFPE
jgi:hypothetical protein